ncbi:hypothetical protein MLD38_003922 [Melastoma candidum]|uniref:Uncharacterized protein n=1 Tax=Melastoma candidum TaxID=119954 RepID=A0ACB9S5F3_9MYRT|nr:hypothetical protein MLD38_003922 [Melastoma candidum]
MPSEAGFSDSELSHNMVFYSGDLQFYLSALEEELLKIHVFRRELPLCYEVVTQTIEAWKEKLKDEVMSPGQTVLEEFQPLKDDNDVNNDVVRVEEEGDNDEDDDREKETKSGWLSSMRLWNPIPDLNAQQDAGEDCQDAALHKKLRRSGSEAIAERSISPSERQQHRRGREKGEEKQKEGSGQRKKRRCWSAELHSQFLNALQELGGPRFASPKHIKARMKVDGLTNEEIKSHLQKYRLHASSPSIQGDGDAPTQPPQAPAHLVIVGSIWVPPSDLPAVTGSSSLAPANKIHAPAAYLADPNVKIALTTDSSSSTHTVTDP